MITLTLDWREVLWWMQGGMSGSHIRWSVYEDMVNKVWPQCSEQERRNLWLIMRRDLGSYWRPDGWSGFDLATAHGDGEWKPAAAVLTYSDDKRYDPAKVITDLTPWMRFRQVLARFDPDQQWAVSVRIPDSDSLDWYLRLTPPASIISRPTNIPKGKHWQSDTATLTVRAYRWQDDYRIDWSRRCDPDRIVKAERIEIPDTGEM